MTVPDLSDIYRSYIACLNKQDWQNLPQFIHDDVCYNGEGIGVSGYRKMLEKDFSEIPDLQFNIELLVADPAYIGARLRFNCTPKGRFLGLDVNGRKVSFTENVFYEFRGERIGQVWSVIDKAAIEAQL
ncbi:ester cyclase [Paraburkholderia sp. MPAMCS5]|uniref:ester cyclase n=1 Tax=Paraburkholderia sp. MPAMCS5 TaxID=3112563 RepID=UPI002E192CE9|nr:ester cyclase [Paraburkholderia sp. MPAMCS5]